MRSFSYVAKLIKDKRLSHPERYSQTQLSKTLGYKNGQFISNLERGLCSIPLKGMVNFVNVLNISEEELKEAILKDYELTLDYYLKASPESSVDSTNSVSAPSITV